MTENREAAGASRRRLPTFSAGTTARRPRLGFLLLAGMLACCSAFAADMNKVIRHAFPAAETGFDPAGAQDLYSGTIEQAIFETLLTYDYLARPARLVPQTAEAMPQVSNNGKVYTFRIKKGIYFSPDPAFKGKKRELTAEDYAYSLKRLIDPKLASPWAWLVENKIEGLDALAEAAKKTGKFDFDA
jgi:ABC-type transport system substrate-binding protein